MSLDLAGVLVGAVASLIGVGLTAGLDGRRRRRLAS
jgi:hypothetical protein